MKNLQKGFTLVELIVVITILAILGTIAFISLQGYSADARNSKRTSDLSSIQSAMTVKVTEGMSIVSFVSGTSANVTGISIAGDSSLAATEYAAGTINHTALGIKASDFQDPKNNADYRVGVTTLKGGKYQLAASMEDDAGSGKARVVGDYIARTSTGSVGTYSGATNTITLTAAQIGSFFPQDTLNGGGTVTKVSADGLTVTTSGTVTTPALNAAETAGLIADGNTTTAAGASDAVVNDSTTTLPY